MINPHQKIRMTKRMTKRKKHSMILWLWVLKEQPRLLVTGTVAEVRAVVPLEHRTGIQFTAVEMRSSKLRQEMLTEQDSTERLLSQVLLAVETGLLKGVESVSK